MVSLSVKKNILTLLLVGLLAGLVPRYVKGQIVVVQQTYVAANSAIVALAMTTVVVR